MSDREKIPEWIDRLNNGELSGQELETLLEMARNDPRLAEEIRLDLELNSVLSEDDVLKLREKIVGVMNQAQKNNGNKFRMILMAASLFLLAGVIVFLLLQRGHRNGKEDQTMMNHRNPHGLRPVPAGHKMDSATALSVKAKESNDTIFQKPGSNLLARFDKNPAFENLIGTTRHAGNFKLISPTITNHFTTRSSVQFLWVPEDPVETELKIMNNSGTLVHESAVLRKNIYSLPPGSLRSGLYYFKIIRGDELIYFGKFSIE